MRKKSWNKTFFRGICMASNVTIKIHWLTCFEWDMLELKLIWNATQQLALNYQFTAHSLPIEWLVSRRWANFMARSRQLEIDWWLTCCQPLSTINLLSGFARTANHMASYGITNWRIAIARYLSKPTDDTQNVENNDKKMRKSVCSVYVLFQRPHLFRFTSDQVDLSKIK